MKKFKKLVSIITAAAVLICSAAFSAGAVRNYDEWVQSWENLDRSNGYIMLTPGADRTYVNFSWQGDFQHPQATLFVSSNADMSGAVSLDVERSFSLFGFEWSFRATASGLKADSTYYYQYTANAEKSETYSFRTGSEDNTRILFVTDSQIGRSRGEQEEIYKNDTYGWTSTLESAFENHGGIDFILSAGDQVEDAYSEEQYSMFESAPLLRSCPVAAAVGNHEFYTPNYSSHFNNPNSGTKVPFRWPCGNGYYFSYNNILFIVADSNNFSASSQDKIFSAACKAYPDAKWRVVLMHHSPYSANSSRDIASVLSMGFLAPYIDKYGIDLCLSGHDHYYSRSYIIKNGRISGDTAKNNCYVNPDGTLHVSGNSASGSNYTDTNPEELTPYCDVWLQTKTPTYSIVSFTQSKLTVTTYEAVGNAILDEVSVEKY